jgi:UDP-glucose pyrophosphorylase
MIETQAEFLMEVTDKTKADVKAILLVSCCVVPVFIDCMFSGRNAHRL